MKSLVTKACRTGVPDHIFLGLAPVILTDVIRVGIYVPRHVTLLPTAIEHKAAGEHTKPRASRATWRVDRRLNSPNQAILPDLMVIAARTQTALCRFRRATGRVEFVTGQWGWGGFEANRIQAGQSARAVALTKQPDPFLWPSGKPWLVVRRTLGDR